MKSIGIVRDSRVVHCECGRSLRPRWLLDMLRSVKRAVGTCLREDVGGVQAMGWRGSPSRVAADTPRDIHGTGLRFPATRINCLWGEGMRCSFDAVRSSTYVQVRRAWQLAFSLPLCQTSAVSSSCFLLRPSCSNVFNHRALVKFSEVNHFRCYLYSPDICGFQVGFLQFKSDVLD